MNADDVGAASAVHLLQTLVGGEYKPPSLGYPLTMTPSGVEAGGAGVQQQRDSAAIDRSFCVDYVDAVPDPTNSLPVVLFFLFVYANVFVLGLAGNVAIVLVTVAYRHMRSVQNIFILNLALSDVIVCLLSLPFTPVTNIYKVWLFGAAICHLLPLVQAVSIFVSTFSLSAIAIDRFILVTRPHAKKLTPQKAVVVAVVLWALSVLVSLPYAYYMQIESYPGFCGQFCTERWPSSGVRRAYALVVLCLQFVLPFLTMSFCYASIFARLRQRARGKLRRLNERQRTLQLSASNSAPNLPQQDPAAGTNAAALPNSAPMSKCQNMSLNINHRLTNPNQFFARNGVVAIGGWAKTNGGAAATIAQNERMPSEHRKLSRQQPLVDEHNDRSRPPSPAFFSLKRLTPDEANAESVGQQTPSLVASRNNSVFCPSSTNGAASPAYARSRSIAAEEKRAADVNKQQRRISSILAMVVLFFGLAWLPHNIVSLIIEYDEWLLHFGGSNLMYLFSMVAHSIAMTTNVANPILYAWLNPSFKELFLRFVNAYFVDKRRRRRGSGKYVANLNHPDEHEELLRNQLVGSRLIENSVCCINSSPTKNVVAKAFVDGINKPVVV